MGERDIRKRLLQPFEKYLDYVRQCIGGEMESEREGWSGGGGNYSRVSTPSFLRMRMWMWGERRNAKTVLSD